MARMARSHDSHGSLLGPHGSQPWLAWFVRLAWLAWLAGSHIGKTRLKTVFSGLKYPKHLVNSTIKSFVDSKVCDQQQPLSPSQEKDDTIRVVLPFKDQISADIVRKQLKDLSLKVRTRTNREGNKATNCKSAVCCLRFSM